VIVLGLTGSIGMGKSATAQLFRDAGVPVHDSDEAVHRLYAGVAARLVEAQFPGVVQNGAVDRARLAAAVVGKPAALATLEGIIHPLVRADADAFLAVQQAADAALVVLDIPLLFETGGEGRVDKIAVVTAPAAVQRARVLARPGMSEAKFAALLAAQVPDALKRARADFVIDTGAGLEAARQSVERVIATLVGDRSVS
jgi:dephospho-CoA kinase